MTVACVLLLVLPLSLYFTTVELRAKQLGDRPLEAPGKGLLQQAFFEPVLGANVHGSDAQLQSHTQRVISAVPWLWFMVSFTLAIKKIRGYLCLKRFLMNGRAPEAQVMAVLESCKMSLRLKGPIGVIVNGNVSSPMLFGFLRPVVILPKDSYEKTELNYILTHELTHYKRGDLWVKALGLIANVIHWFNPLSYYLVHSINHLCELSCDEAVVVNLDFPARKLYAATILNSLGRSVSFPVGVYSTLSGNKRDIKRRLNHMLNYKSSKRGHMVLSLCLALVLCISGVVAATAKLSPEPEAPDAALQNNLSMTWPTPGTINIALTYGERIHPISSEAVMHHGIDIVGNQGDAIVAAAKGIVVFAEFQRDYGRTVIIDHGEGLATLYAHCSTLFVNVDDRVDAGQKIAQIGMTGLATAPHLHFEIRKNQTSVDPLIYVTP